MEPKAGFTVQQIKAVHARVKSGADFPKYVQEIGALGVVRYEAYVADGRIDYWGTGNYKTSSTPSYAALEIAPAVNLEQFKKDLKRHQQGETSYMQFVQDCAKGGVEKWILDIAQKKCTYYDRSGAAVLTESIPAP